jgi:hypothetical protein
MTLSNYNRKEYRKDIERYSIDKMFKSFDNIIKKGDK